jgi:hypothetical protein
MGAKAKYLMDEIFRVPRLFQPCLDDNTAETAVARED